MWFITIPAAEAVHKARVFQLAAAPHKVPAGEDVVLQVPGAALAVAGREGCHAGRQVSGVLRVVPNLDLLCALGLQRRQQELPDIPHALRDGVDQDLHTSASSAAELFSSLRFS